jgi:hypothetical protein
MALKNPISRIIAKAWVDDQFKRDLLANPKDVLKSEGIDIEDDIEIAVFENTAKKKHYVLPENPQNRPLTDADFEIAIAAGATSSDGNCL